MSAITQADIRVHYPFFDPKRPGNLNNGADISTNQRDCGCVPK
jgi:hypothetical protein